MCEEQAQPKCILGFGNPLVDIVVADCDEADRMAWNVQWGEAMLGKLEHRRLLPDLLHTKATEYFAGAEAIDGHPTPLHILERNQI